MQLPTYLSWSVVGLCASLLQDGLAAPSLRSRESVDDLQTRRIEPWQQHGVRMVSRSLALPLQSVNITNGSNPLTGNANEELLVWLDEDHQRYMVLKESEIKLPQKRVKDLIEKALAKLDEAYGKRPPDYVPDDKEYNWFKGKIWNRLQLSITPEKVQPVSPATATTLLTISDLVDTITAIKAFYKEMPKNQIVFDVRAVERAGERNALLAKGFLSRSLSNNDNSTQLDSEDSSSFS